VSDVTGGNFSRVSMAVCSALNGATCGRFMPHNGARNRQWLACHLAPPQGRSAEGVDWCVGSALLASIAVRSSPVYGEEPSASADPRPRGQAALGRRPGGRAVLARARGRALGHDPDHPAYPRHHGQCCRRQRSSSGGQPEMTPQALDRVGLFPVAPWRGLSRCGSGQVYLNYSSSTAAQRAQQLAAFIPGETSRAKDPQFGWNGSGTSVTQSTEVAGSRRGVSADTAVVTLPR